MPNFELRSDLGYRWTDDEAGRRPHDLVVLVDGPHEGELRYLDESESIYTIQSWVFHVCSPACTAPGAVRCEKQVRSTETTYRIEHFGYQLREGTHTTPGLMRLGFSAPTRPEASDVAWYALYGLAWSGRLAWEELPAHPSGPDNGARIDAVRVITVGGTPAAPCTARVDRHANGTYTGACTCWWRTGATSLRNLGRLARMCLEHERPRHIAWPRTATTARHRSAASEPPAIDYLDTPQGGSTCAHVCGPDPDHVCDARASTYIEHKNLAGGTRRLPLCGPCHTSETAALKAARFGDKATPVEGTR